MLRRQLVGLCARRGFLEDPVQGSCPHCAREAACSCDSCNMNMLQASRAPTYVSRIAVAEINARAKGAIHLLCAHALDTDIPRAMASKAIVLHRGHAWRSLCMACAAMRKHTTTAANFCNVQERVRQAWCDQGHGLLCLMFVARHPIAVCLSGLCVARKVRRKKDRCVITPLHSCCKRTTIRNAMIMEICAKWIAFV